MIVAICVFNEDLQRIKKKVNWKGPDKSHTGRYQIDMSTRYIWKKSSWTNGKSKNIWFIAIYI